MKKINLFLILLIICETTVSTLYAQKVVFSEDEKERGYYNRPYIRYEAEPGKCQTNGEFLEASDQKTVESEASNRIAAELAFKDSYIQWTCDEDADGFTIRFSLPDGSDGLGTKGTLALYVNDVFIRDVTLDSYWAWQYFRKGDSNSYPDNNPNANSFPRMRFDEMHLKLDEKIPAGSTFKLVKTEEASLYTIDFVELEPVPEPITFESITDDNKVMFEGGNLKSFIESNGGKTIYIPEGKYNVSGRIYIRTDNTKIIGAGMWHTELYFEASSNNSSTYSNRGIETNNNNITIEGLYMNTINNQRYYQSNSSYQVGKALMGSLGSNSVIRNVWAEHFECGAWIANYGSNTLFSDNLLVQHCRFRNNYADGINLCRGTKNATVEYCSFRNNGDDDMASWSASYVCKNNTFRYSTAENNWRASSLGIFGGEYNYSHNLLIMDGMENGIRINGDFDAKEGDGNNRFENISVYRCGAISGTVGENGDLWGNAQAAVQIATTTRFELKDIKFSNIDIYNSRRDAIQISGNMSSKQIIGLSLKDITIDGTGRYGIYFSSARGNAEYCNLNFSNLVGSEMNPTGNAFTFTENCDDPESINSVDDGIHVFTDNNHLFIKGFNTSIITLYNLIGEIIYQTGIVHYETMIPNLSKGMYIVKLSNYDKIVKVVVGV